MVRDNWTEEQKRNLRVDIKKIDEWETELSSIDMQFKKFNLTEVANAAKLIRDVLQELLSLDRYFDSDEKFQNWITKLSLTSLIRLAEYDSPQFIREKKYLNLTKQIRLEIDDVQNQLSKIHKRGVTSSLIVTIFTDKASDFELNIATQRLNKYIKLSEKSFEIECASYLLDEIWSLSNLSSKRRADIQNKIYLASVKKEAIQKFEDKHGRAFAKAAASDKQTRVRATSLKRLVEKTSTCPYCGNSLGSEPHLDHIYPVSKGGLSIVENLVWCCSVCNSSKSDKGLIQFLQERGLSIDIAVSRLVKMGKHV